MANLIKLKRSSTSGNNPTTSNLELGELAINTYDGNLFFKKDSGTASIVAVTTLDGTQTLTNKTLASPVITGTLTAGGGVGTNGQILVSTGTGVQWTSGGVGATGAQGASGVLGASGVQGASGATGTAGTNGATGVSGASGAQGVQGASGATGAQGIQGASGATGVFGATGVQGASGSTGISGATGPSTAINATNDTSTTVLYPVFVGAAGSNQTPKVTTTKLAWNASTGSLTITGSLFATTKSFKIAHPTKEGMVLTYGSLEGPENGVYVRGKLSGSDTIELPDYWTKLIDPNSITISLTPIGKHQNLYVKEIADNKVVIGNSNLLGKDINCFYIVYAERADVEKLQVEVN